VKITLVFSGGRTLGVEYIAASLKRAGHEVSLLFDPVLFYGTGIKSLRKFFDSTPILMDKIIKFNPDLVAFSVLSDTYGWACSFSEKIKEWKDVPILFGGLHATAVPDIIIKEKYIDYVCVGEGDEAAVDLAAAIEAGEDTTKIPNIWTLKEGQVFENRPRALIRDLNNLPFPGEGTFYGEFKDYRYFSKGYSILTSRGCTNKCTFCMNSLLSKIYAGDGPYLRRRSVDNVIEELHYSKEKYKVKYFSFEDDVFTQDSKWLKEFCQRYKEEIALPFCCQVHPYHLNKEVLQDLEAAGCMAVGMGIQSVDAALIKEILHRDGDSQEIAKAIELFKNSKISLLTQILLDFPGQSEEEIVNIARFLNKYKPDFVLAFRFRHYPRMEIIEVARQRGLISPAEIKTIEESKEYSPYIMGINIFYAKAVSMLLPLLIISPNLPEFVLNFILDKKIYRHNSFFLRIIFHLYSMLVSLYKKIFSGKKRFYYFTPSGMVKYFLYYIFTNIPKIISIRRKKRNDFL